MSLLSQWFPGDDPAESGYASCPCGYGDGGCETCRAEIAADYESDLSLRAWGEAIR